jgi:hypothetical protein
LESRQWKKQEDGKKLCNEEFKSCTSYHILASKINDGEGEWWACNVDWG